MTMPDSTDNYPDPEERPDLIRGTLNFPVVGIGASAGGMSALLRFFETMPANNGMAFVIILHLSPKHESNAAAILQRVTTMPVMQVVEHTPIEVNHVYVVPPTHDLSMSGNALQLVGLSKTFGGHVSIDLFFRTLAHVHQERCIAIVMSGTGTDGSLGIARVKEQGGVTVAQAPLDAEHDGMPVAAIATGLIDFVLSAVEMPQRLLDLWMNASRISLPKDADPSMRVLAPSTQEAARAAEEALRDIMALLRSHSRNDFRHYKRATVLRRIERRLQVKSLPDLPSYRDYLRENPAEAKPLLQDMLISVTNFFRDREAFEALERNVLPQLLDRRSPDEPLRVWIAGCATGEEAYSVTMLLREYIDEKPNPPELTVFATDIDERAIAVARAGLYSASVVTDVAPSRVKQFFTPENGRLRVAKSVREKVLFAPHNILRDPPFSKVDLICCRNLLIYLDREAQTSVLEMFRFALKPDGYLFLGTSESADAAPDLFSTVDKKNRIFRANPHAHASRHLPFVSETPIERAAQSRAAEGRRELPAPNFADLHKRCIEQAAAPSVLIDDKFTVLHLSDSVGKFLLHSGGQPTLNLLSNLHADLRTELRTALFQAAGAANTAQTRAIKMQWRGEAVFVRMRVRAFQDGLDQQRLMLVAFEEVAAPAHAGDAAVSEPASQSVVAQFENELKLLKAQLQETIEQAETSTEELKASNEELQAINEEMRLASEELETSKEELQAMNEELVTVNFELKVKVEETNKINDDLQNLVASSDIATVFIDRGLRVKRYTPQATAIFNLIASDAGRSLLDITHGLNYDKLEADVAEVFKSLALIERRILSHDGRHYLARLRPYRTNDDRIDGAVLTFIDVTALRMAEEELRERTERLRIVAETTKDYAILTIDEQGIVTTWNLGAERMFGYTEEEITGQSFALLFTPHDRASGAPELEMRRARVDARVQDERWHRRKDGSVFFCSGVTTPLEGEQRGFAKIARDITETIKHQENRDELLAREQAANELKDQFLAVMSHELKHPLNLIQVNTELLVNQPDLKGFAAVARAGETIQRAVSSQAKIIDDLLDLSRVRTGKLALRPECVNLNDLVSSIVLAAQDASRQKGLYLQAECDVPDINAFCDRVRTEQIFWNLINNAIKFTPNGGRVLVKLEREEDVAKFTVIDTGQGIAPEFLARVFDMFTQEAALSNLTVRSQSAGLGVGLALVRELVTAQGGRVLAESEGIDQGATFSIWLPLDNALPEQPELSLKPQSLQGMRILAVDDMLEALEPFAELLRLGGAHVDIAGSGEAALAKLDAQPYDLLVSDLGMDEMDGYSLIWKVRQNPAWQSLKAIALSGYGRQVDVDRALRSGFNGHLSKPASMLDIQRAVAKLT